MKPTIVRYKGDTKIPVSFNLKVPCSGERLTAQVYEIGNVLVGSVHTLSETVNGGAEGEERTLTMDFSALPVGQNYSIVITTTETGVIDKGVLVILAEDGYSSDELTNSAVTPGVTPIWALLTDSGDGNSFLADDGEYRPIDYVGTIGTGVWEGTDVGVAHGGTGASTASGARTNLGLEIGSDVLAYSAVLSATTASFLSADRTKIDGIETGATADQSGAEIKVAYESQADTNAYTDSEKIIVANTSGTNTGDQDLSGIATNAIAIGLNTTHRGLTSGNPHNVTPTELGLVIGTDVQAYDANTVIGGGTVTDHTIARYDTTSGKLLQGSGVIINDSDDISGVNNLSTIGNLVIGGDFTVTGTTNTNLSQNIYIEDSLGFINFGEAGAGVTTLVQDLYFAGWELDRGSNNPYRWGYNESDDLWKIGEYFISVILSSSTGTFALNDKVTSSGGATGYVVSASGSNPTQTIVLKGISGTFTTAHTITTDGTGTGTINGAPSVTNTMQAIATREDSPTDNALTTWDSATGKLITSSTLTYSGGQLTIANGTSNSEVGGSSIYLNGAASASYSVIQQGVGTVDFWGHNGSSWKKNLSIDNANGGISVRPDEDVTTILGRALISSPNADYAHFSHINNTGATEYAFAQGGGATAGTYINAKSGDSIIIRNAGLTAWTINSSGNLIGSAGNTLTVAPDEDVATILGRTRIDSRVTNQAIFSHYDLTGLNDYALTHSPFGSTVLNASSGREVVFAINNVSQWTINSSGNLIGSAGNTLTVAPDEDVTTILGRARIDTRVANYMILSHNDLTAGSNYILAQHSNGEAHLNAPSGRNINFNIQAAAQWQINSSGNLIGSSGNTLTVAPDEDVTTILGRTRIDSRFSDFAYISHYNFTGLSDFGFLHSNAGRTSVNSAAGQELRLSIGGFTQWSINSSGNLIGSAGNTLTVDGAVTGTNLNISNWDTAHGWGDHGAAGYGTASASGTANQIQVNNGSSNLSASSWESAGTEIYLKTTVSSAGSNLGYILGKWGALGTTNIAGIQFTTGDDTGNKDNGRINFYTSASGSLIKALEINESQNFDFQDNNITTTGEARVGLFNSTSPNTSVIQNTTDSSLVRVLNYKGGERATAVNGDENYFSMWAGDSGGGNNEYSRFSWISDDVTQLSRDGRLRYSVMVNGTMTSIMDIHGTGLDVTGSITSTSTGTFNPTTHNTGITITSGVRSQLNIITTLNGEEVATSWKDTSVSAREWKAGISLAVSKAFTIRDNTTGVDALTLASITGNATFGGAVGINESSPDADLHIKNSTNGWDGGIKLEAENGSNFASLHQENGSGLWFGMDNTNIIKFLNDGTIQAIEVYNNTSASAANVYIDSNGLFHRSTSSKKYKSGVAKLNVSDKQFMQLESVSYHRKGDNSKKNYFGYIAEQVHDIGLTELVDYNSNGEADALHYGQFTALNTLKIQETIIKTESNTERITRLEEENKELRGLLANN